MSDIEAIKARHKAWNRAYECNDATKQCHHDRAFLLSALSASEARAEAAEARVGELERIGQAILDADERGQGQPFSEAMDALACHLKGATKTKCQSCGGTGEVYSEEIGTGIQCSYCLGEGATDGR